MVKKKKKKKKKIEITDFRKNKCNVCDGSDLAMMNCHKCKEKLI